MKRVAVVTILLSLLAVGCAADVGRPRAVSLGDTPPVMRVGSSTRPTPSPPEPTVEVSSVPAFHSHIALIGEATQERMRYSWHDGCPVGLDDLRLITLSFWGLDRRDHTGELMVHRDVAHDVVRVFRALFEARFSIERMRLVDVYEADDDRSMAADNTSAFNCRYATGHPGVWSEHAYGRAIDINPVLNPYVSADGTVLPEEGTIYADRSRVDPGIIHAGDVVVGAFSDVGWEWGGSWTSFRDYQHFSESGR